MLYSYVVEYLPWQDDAEGIEYTQLFHVQAKTVTEAKETCKNKHVACAIISVQKD